MTMPAPAFQPTPPTPPTLIVFDGDGKEVAKLSDAEHFYSSLTFDPTGKALIAVTGGEVVMVWNAQTGKLAARYRTNDPKVAISPDGRFLALHRPVPLSQPVIPVAPQSGDGKDSPSKEPDAPPLEPTFQPASPMPGGKQMMWVTVIELDTGKLVWNASAAGTGHGGMAFSADGKRLALGLVDDKAGIVQVWDTAAPGNQPFQHQVVARYLGHRGPVNAVAFSPDGTKLASGGDDRMVKVWRLPAPAQLGPGGRNAPGFGGPSVALAPNAGPGN
jgi:WD40 repeat protein